MTGRVEELRGSASTVGANSATIHAAAPCFPSWAIRRRDWLGNSQCRRIGPSRLKSLASAITAPLLYSLRQTPPDSIGRVSSREGVLHGADGFPHPLAARK